ncbi:Homocysteine S-methyltransferase [Baffinella frigidus]|nr:Homocysteine S-methyltransferase [Cryptophyta sp. CCMP2293]
MPRAVLLDGGMGHQLKKMGVKVEGPRGSMERFLGVAMANSTQSELVTAAHLSFIDAGADVITTNNYAVVPNCLALCADFKGNLGEKVKELVGDAGKAARAAVEQRPDRKVLVAGCLPPLAESYRTDRVGSFEANVAQYTLIAESIAPYSDVLLCETMSTPDEARAAATAASKIGKPVWVAWTLDKNDPVLMTGESLSAAVAALEGLPNIKAILFNCSYPEIVTKAIAILRKEPSLPAGVVLGGYANGFSQTESGDGLSKEYRDISPEEYWGSFAKQWIDDAGDGAIVGGCCGIFPPHIARLRAGIDRELSPQRDGRAML